MARREEHITLDCGIAAKRWTYSKKEYLEISLYGLYNGYGLNEHDTHKLENVAALFKELLGKGYEVSGGISLVNGYYDSVDDLLLTVSKNTKK